MHAEKQFISFFSQARVEIGIVSILNTRFDVDDTAHIVRCAHSASLLVPIPVRRTFAGDRGPRGCNRHVLRIAVAAHRRVNTSRALLRLHTDAGAVGSLCSLEQSVLVGQLGASGRFGCLRLEASLWLLLISRGV